MNRNDRDVGKLPFELIRASRFEDVQLGNMRRQVMNRPTRRCGRPRLTPLCASLLMLGIGAVSSPGLAQTISLTSASPSYDVGSSTYSIVGLTVADNVNGVITGAGGTLDYTGASAPFVLGGTTGGAPQNLNMSGLSNFVFDNPTQSFSVGGRFGGTGNSSTTSATLTLAANSIITASSFNVGTSPNSAANAVLNSGTVNLGASTTINADTINVGTSVKSSGTLTLAAGGTLVLRGTDGSSPVANWTIGANGQSSLQPTTGNVNLSGGSIDAEVTNLLIGQTGPSGSQATSGTLTLGSGTLDVTSIVLGQSTTTSTANATGTLTIGGTLVNAQTVTLGNHLDASGTITGIVNLNGGGTLLAQTIQGGAGTATRTFNWNGGTLGNYAPGDDLTVSIPTIALASGGGQIFDIEGTGATATVSSVLSGAGGFTKTGAGLLALTGTNTYTGGTTVTGGLVNFSTLSNLGTGDITLNGGGLQWATGSTVDVSTQLNPLGPNGATFDTNGNNVTLAGNLTGTNGVLIKQGNGTLTLTGADTYSGGTQINAGTLQVGAGGTLGSIQGDVVDNAALAFNLSTTTTFGGVISGAGTVAQLGSGTTIFTGDNTYTGATTISAGTLQLGNGSTSGSIVSNVVDNGTLSIDRSDTVTLPSVISGSGSLRQAGTGTTILTADNTYTGATTITAGTLQLGNGGVSGSVAGNVVDLGTLAFDRSDTSTYAGQISGSGTLNQIGSGTTILTGDNTYTGATTISAGTLQLGNGGTTGSVANASAIVDNGTLAIDHSNNVYFVSGITGTGALNQLGTGTTVLQATNTYAGGTTISAGTLQLGNGGTSGSIVGDVVDNGTLAFNRANATTFDGAISGTGAVTTLGSGPTILTADNTYTGGTTITAGSGTLQLSDGNTTGSIVGDVLDNGVLAVDRSNTVTLPGVISGSGLLSQAGTGTTILTGDNTYTGSTTISAGTLQLGNGGTTGSVVSNITDSGTLAFNRSDDIVYSNIISGTGGLNQLGPGTLQLEGAQTYTGPTNVLAGVLAVDGSIQSDTTTIAPGATLSGFGDLFGDVINQGTVWPGNAIVGDTNYGTLTIHGNYTGQGGVLELNTYLGGDGSPSDVLAIDGGAATGTTGVIIHNTAAGGAETSGNGILVVSAINGATTAADAFNLIGETRSGALDYRLFRGSVDGTSADSWYLRNDFIVPPEPPEPPEPPQPPEPPLPPDPPPEPLPPGVYPIIGPEVATYGVVQPIARELGLLTLGTMDQRIGDSALMASSTAATDPGPSAWGRLFATNINNTYRAFAAPQANGNLYGFQTGADVWQGQLFEGHTDRFGGYVSYGQADISVRGLVTNAEATNYAMQHTGELTLRATSAGAYWTHYGPGGWYLDGVVQASTYNGAATTQDARLNTNGVGFAGSLEFGYPFALPQLGTSFVLEPQVQTIWQHTAFSDKNDGLGDVALGSTNGSTGRVGVRGKWQLTSQSGQLWEPYAAVNFWRDWGGRSATVFGDSSGGTSAAPLVPQASRAELAGGVTAKLLARLSVYGSLGYEHELGSTANAKREGINADVGLRYTW